ncbi:HupE/UreJ family protein [Agarivorans albus]
MKSIYLVFFLLITTSITSYAHNLGEGGHLVVTLDEKGHAELQFDLTTGELNKRFNLDENSDGKLSVEEERNYPANAISQYISNNLSVRFDGKSCEYTISNHKFVIHGSGNYLRFLLEHQCPTIEQSISASYHLLFENDEDHSGSMHLTQGDAMTQVRFFSDQREQSISLEKISITQTIKEFLLEGIWHIWIGLDHILFLVCLILPAVLFISNKQWHAKESFKEVTLETLKIVTAFTVAHSITLISAVLGWVSLPPARITESIIALSVIVVALNCLFPRVNKQLTLITFIFGLIHGFGFANVLLELSLPKTATYVALIAFNVGVEVGQLIIVAVLLPLLFYCREFKFYQTFILRGGSSLVGIVALIWLAERASGIDFNPLF